MGTHASNADLAEQHLVQTPFLGLHGLQNSEQAFEPLEVGQ